MIHNDAWLAGLFEGEGCITIHPRGKVRITVAMVDRDVIELAQKTAGGYGTLHNRKPYHEKWKPQVVWAVNKKSEVFNLVGRMYPYLCARRRRRCLEALMHAMNYQPKGSFNGNKTHCPKGHAYTADNTSKFKDGARRCLTCHRQREFARKHTANTLQGVHL